MTPYLYPNLPNWIDPKEVKTYDSKPDWIAERKKNGWRCLAIRTEGGLTLWTRRHTIIPDLLPIVRTELSKLPPNTIIDGELMEKRTKEIKDHFYAFDILYFNNSPLVSLSWKRRRDNLERALFSYDVIVDLAEPITLGKSVLYNLAVESGDEGIVLKNINSQYLVNLKSCSHNPHWLKAKRPEKAFLKEAGR